MPGPQPAPHCHPPALGAVTNIFSECQCRLDPLGVPCHCTGAGGHSLRQPRAGPSPFLRTKGVRVGSLPCRAGMKRFRCALHVTGPAATAFSRPRPLQTPGLLERPVTTAQLFPPPATRVEPRLASALVPGPRPWAHPGFFSVVKIRQGQGAVEALGRLAAEGQAGLGPQWSTRRVLSASREQRGSRPRRLPARPRHGSVAGQNSDLLPVPKASGILRPPPQFPASWPTRPWPSHQGPAALLSFQCAWSLESRKPVPRPCSLCGPGTRLPREAQHEQRKSESESGTAPCPPLQSHLHSPGSGFKVSLRVLGTKGILSRERLSDAVWSLGIEALFLPQ